jgi:phosphohistidine phosphatase SixA
MKIGKRSFLGTGAFVLTIVAVSAVLGPVSVAAQSGSSVAGTPQVSEVSPRSSTALNVPRAIYLMRHAEKPDSSNDPHLSAAGVARADKLPGYFPTLLADGQSVDYIFATKASKNSNRPVETITPLAESLRFPIDQSYANRSYRALAEAILSNGSYAQKTILIAWHHGTMPKLARALGARNVPKKWPGASFDMIWKLTYLPDGGASLQQIKEPF